MKPTKWYHFYPLEKESQRTECRWGEWKSWREQELRGNRIRWNQMLIQLAELVLERRGETSKKREWVEIRSVGRKRRSGWLLTAVESICWEWEGNRGFDLNDGGAWNSCWNSLLGNWPDVVAKLIRQGAAETRVSLWYIHLDPKFSWQLS